IEHRALPGREGPDDARGLSRRVRPPRGERARTRGAALVGGPRLPQAADRAVREDRREHVARRPAPQEEDRAARGGEDDSQAAAGQRRRLAGGRRPGGSRGRPAAHALARDLQALVHPGRRPRARGGRGAGGALGPGQGHLLSQARGAACVQGPARPADGADPGAEAEVERLAAAADAGDPPRGRPPGAGARRRAAGLAGRRVQRDRRRVGHRHRQRLHPPLALGSRRAEPRLRARLPHDRSKLDAALRACGGARGRARRDAVARRHRRARLRHPRGGAPGGDQDHSGRRDGAHRRQQGPRGDPEMMEWVYLHVLVPVLNVLYLPCDWMLLWSSRLPPIASITISSVVSGVAMVLVLKYCSDQKFLGQAKADLALLKGKMKAAKEAKDPEALSRARALSGRIGGKFMGASLKPSLWTVPIMAVLGLWTGSRLGYLPIHPGDEFSVVAHFEDNAKGFAYVQPDAALQGSGPWIAPVEIPQDGGGLQARWKLRANAPGDVRFQIRHGEHSYEIPIPLAKSGG